MSSFKLKVLLTGAVAVGKTRLFQRIIKNRFAANYKLTVGVNILTKDVEFKPGEVATLSIWDIGGQQRFKFIRSTFYKGAVGVLLVFDLTREQTYIETKRWLTEIRQFSNKNIPFLIIGNFFNMLNQGNKALFRKEVRGFAESEGGLYIETSPDEIDVVEKAIYALTRRIIGIRSRN